MRTMLTIENGRTQIVLTPDTDTDRMVLATIQSDRQIRVCKGSFYQCLGGWTRQGSDDQSTILVIGGKEPADG